MGLQPATTEKTICGYMGHYHNFKLPEEHEQQHDNEHIQKISNIVYDSCGNQGDLTHFKITNMYLSNDQCSFTFGQVIKHSRPGFNSEPLIFRAFPQDIRLCPVYHTKLYLRYRLNVSLDLGFFTTTIQPYHAALMATISRWIKETLVEAGINTGKFAAHSCCSVSTTAAEFLGIDIITIRIAAGWSTENTFIRHYRKKR